MTERALPVDGAPACPFVAFEDDRDARSTAPDHRHRCYAEARPAPRALAHQEAYCLSSAFPVCPTFQDWARREAAPARPRPAGTGERVRVETQPVVTPLPEAAEAVEPPRPESETPPPLPPHRPAHRDWAAPPPWLADGDTGSPSEPSVAAPPFLGERVERAERPTPPEARGLSGSAADRLAGGGLDDDDRPGLAAAAGSGVVRPAERSLIERERRTGDERGAAWAERPGRRRDRVPAERQRVDPDERDASQLFGPAWERPRRAEAYPSLRTRMALPSLSQPLVIGLAALLLAAAALFFLPAFLGVGGDDEPSPTPSASVAPTPTPPPTEPPAPTPTVHVVAEGDTLSRIAAQYGLTLEQILAANPEITNPNRIAVGDRIVIPTAPPEEVPGEGAEVTPAP